jgi:hypothetical protein
MITHDVGEYFWGIDVAHDIPFYCKTTVHENEHPFRVSRAHVIDLKCGKAFVFGRWCPGNPSIEKHLMEALRARLVPQTA